MLLQGQPGCARVSSPQTGSTKHESPSGMAFQWMDKCGKRCSPLAPVVQGLDPGARRISPYLPPLHLCPSPDAISPVGSSPRAHSTAECTLSFASPMGQHHPQPYEAAWGLISLLPNTHTHAYTGHLVFESKPAIFQVPARGSS